MDERSIMLGLDVHKETIAVARPSRWAPSPNDPRTVARLLRKLGPAEPRWWPPRWRRKRPVTGSSPIGVMPSTSPSCIAVGY